MGAGDVKTLVISAPNLIEGGGLQVLRDCVDAAARLNDRVATTVLVHNRDLLPRDDVTIIEIPNAKRSWWRRVDTEYRRFKSLSQCLRPDVWLSLHDMTPNVVAGRQYVYCHNPAPFYRPSLRQMWQEPTFAAFNLLYGLLYRINIQRNAAVIVQQDWLRREFLHRYPVRDVITAVPSVGKTRPPVAVDAWPARIFLYPAFPRAFKNLEIICHAVRQLSQNPAWQGEIRFTIDGTENRYARWIARMSADLPAIRLIGRQDATGMQRQYDEADVVLFPSTLETWGLPITEAKARGKPLLLAQLPYAHETLGDYDGGCFLDPTDAAAWADAMERAAAGRYAFAPAGAGAVRPPDAADWDELLARITAFVPSPVLCD
jgi:glycosyltransferase involved in cell wall biosynthesis